MEHTWSDLTAGERREKRYEEWLKVPDTEFDSPEQLLEAIDVVTDITIDNLIQIVNSQNGLMTLFVLHKGSDGFLSSKQFEKFYWPSLRKLIQAFIDEGIIPILFAEGSYDTRIETCNEFNTGEVVWYSIKRTWLMPRKSLVKDVAFAVTFPHLLLLPGLRKKYRNTVVN